MLRGGCTFYWTAKTPTDTFPLMKHDEEYHALLDAQRRLSHCILNDKTSSKDVAACARVLVSVLDYKRIKRMKPKPKDMDVSKLQRRARATPQAMPQPIEPPAADAA